MTTLEKLNYLKDHGISITYIASRADLVPATITRWMRGEKGISKKNEKIIALTLQQIAQEIWEGVSEEYDRNL